MLLRLTNNKLSKLYMLLKYKQIIIEVNKF